MGIVKNWFTISTLMKLLVIIFSIGIEPNFARAADSSNRNSRKETLNDYDESNIYPAETEHPQFPDAGDNSNTAGNIQHWLVIENSPKSIETVKLHGDLTLRCEVGGSPPPTVSWLKNGERIDNILTHDSEEKWSHRIDEVRSGRQDDNQGYVMSNVVSKLFLSCVRPGDEGQYSCVAQNAAKQIEAKTYVSIEDNGSHTMRRHECKYKTQYLDLQTKDKFSHGINKINSHGAPYILTSETLHMEPIGNNVVLPCKSVGFPKPKITWFDPEGQDITSNNKFLVSTTGSLLIRKVTWEEMGEYTCQAENKMGSEMAVTFVYPLLPK